MPVCFCRFDHLRNILPALPEAFRFAGRLRRSFQEAGIAQPMAGALQFRRHLRQCLAERFPVPCQQVQRAPVGAGNHRDIVFCLHAPFDLQAGNSRVAQLRQQGHQAQVARGEKVGPPLILRYREVLPGPFFLHHGILPAAGLGAFPAVAAPPGQICREHAPPGIGHAARTMHKRLQLDPVPDPLMERPNAVQAHFTGQDHPLAPQAAVQLNRRRVHSVRLRAHMDRQGRHLRTQEADRAGIRDDRRVHAAVRCFLRRRGEGVQFVIKRIGVHRDIEPPSGFVGQADCFPQFLRPEVARKGPQAEMQGGPKGVHVPRRR